MFDPDPFVRKAVSSDGWRPEFDIIRVGPWGKHFRIKADELHEMRVTVFDMDREDWWDKGLRCSSRYFRKIHGKDYGPPFIYCSIVEEAAFIADRRLAKEDDKVLLVGQWEATKSYHDP